MRTRTHPIILAGCLLFLASGGCSDWSPKVELTTRPAGTMDGEAGALQAQVDEAMRGTIGANVFVQGTGPLRVRGYGLVIRLVGKGSRNCPPSVREYLRKEIMRNQVAGTPPEERKNLPPTNDLIDSLDTAVVVVDGELPPGAGKRQVFDVRIQAIDPDVRSLEGGYLLPCELKLYRDVGPAELVTGKTHARATGPVFVNPFAATGGGTTIDPREGRVIGGGSVIEERPLTLVCTTESYALVRQIQDVINRRMAHDPPVATALNPRHILLRPPPEARRNITRFLERILYLPLDQSPPTLERRTRELITELTRPEAAHETIALALEGIGSATVPALQPLYTHARRPVHYYAARTGLRLGDPLALEVIITHARDPDSPFRRQAVGELGRAGRKVRAARTLRELLDDTDPKIRLLAYESLREADPEAIARMVVGRRPENFLLELVDCQGPPLIYARRTLSRRIALLGGDRMTCRPPLLYHDPAKPIVLSADVGDRMLTLLRRDRAGTTTLGPIRAPMALPALIRLMGENLSRDPDGRIEGLDLDYSLILEVLYRLSEKGAINAQVRWEEPDVEDVLGPMIPLGRPESEL